MEVTLRPIVDADNTLLLRWRSDPRNIHWFFSGAVPTKASQARWFEEYNRRVDEILYVIVLENVGPIGTIGLNGIDSHQAEVGRVLIGEPELRGKGYARAALEALEKIARTCYSVDSLFLEVLEENQLARRLYERCGFVTVEARLVVVNGLGRTALRMEKQLEALDVAS